MRIDVKIKLNTGFQYELRQLVNLKVEDGKLLLIEAYSQDILEGTWSRHTYDTLLLKDVKELKLITN